MEGKSPLPKGASAVDRVEGSTCFYKRARFTADIQDDELVIVAIDIESIQRPYGLFREVFAVSFLSS